VYGKHWARNISADDIEQPFWTFFGHTQPDTPTMPFTPSEGALRTAAFILPVYIARLRKLLHLCQSAPLWRFYASSILFSYQLQDQQQQQQQQQQPLSTGDVALSMDAVSHASASFPVAGRSELHLIDFGHAYPIDRALPAHLHALLDDTSVPADGEARMNRPHSDDSVTPCTCGLPAAALDVNYIAGITSLIRIFERMLERTRAARV
jgi:hypothetical protein